MERFVLSCKLIGVAILVIVAILSLSVKDAYGLGSATAGFGLPELKRGQPPQVGRVYSPDEMMVSAEVGSLREFAGDEGVFQGSAPCIPEPATLLLLGAGIAGLRLIKVRR